MVTKTRAQRDAEQREHDMEIWEAGRRAGRQENIAETEAALKLKAVEVRLRVLNAVGQCLTANANAQDALAHVFRDINSKV